MLHSKKDPIPSVHNWSNPHTQYPSGVNARLRVWRDDRSLVVCAYMRFVRRDGTKELGSAQLDAHVSSHKHTQGERERERALAGYRPDRLQILFLFFFFHAKALKKVMRRAHRASRHPFYLLHSIICTT